MCGRRLLECVPWLSDRDILILSKQGCPKKKRKGKANAVLHPSLPPSSFNHSYTDLHLRPLPSFTLKEYQTIRRTATKNKSKNRNEDDNNIHSRERRLLPRPLPEARTTSAGYGKAPKPGTECTPAHGSFPPFRRGFTKKRSVYEEEISLLCCSVLFCFSVLTGTQLYATT